MKYLNFEENLKKRLLSVGALATDCDGDEVLIGLTVAESNFILDLPQVHPSALGPAEIRLFLYLYRLHSAAFAKICGHNN